MKFLPLDSPGLIIAQVYKTGFLAFPSLPFSFFLSNLLETYDASTSKKVQQDGISVCFLVINGDGVLRSTCSLRRHDEKKYRV